MVNSSGDRGVAHVDPVAAAGDADITIAADRSIVRPQPDFTGRSDRFLRSQREKRLFPRSPTPLADDPKRWLSADNLRSIPHYPRAIDFGTSNRQNECH